MFANVQALRACAAMLVVFEHLGKSNGIEAHYFVGQTPLLAAFGEAGRFGVDLFFAISGFIMIYTTWKVFGRTDASWKFLLRRCIRIYPAYWLVLVPLMIVYRLAPERLTQFHAVRTDLVASFLLFPQAGQPLLAVAWTLVYEMFFYLVFTVLLCFGRRHLPWAVSVWLVSEIILSLTLKNQINPYLSFFSNPFAIDFIFGLAVGYLHLTGRLRASFPVVAALGVICTGLAIIGSHSGDMWVGHRVVFFGIPAAALVAAGLGLELSRGVCAPRWFAAVGDTSFALYLWHLPVLSALAQVIGRIHPRGMLAHVVLVTLMLAFMIGFARIIYSFAERPITAFLNNALLSRGRRRVSTEVA